MTDTQLLREILAELKKIKKELQDANSQLTSIEGGVWDK
jgi:hypothetical protein